MTAMGLIRMRSCVPLLLLTACTVAQRPPPLPRPVSHFSVEAGRQLDPRHFRRMADWDFTHLDCPDCSSVAKQARTPHAGEGGGALTALCLPSPFRQHV